MTKVLVVGGTGAMGTPVVRRLATRAGAEVSVLTRDPDSSRARALLDAGNVRLVQGSVDDVADVASALVGVEEVFCNTDFFATASPVREYEQGLEILAAAEAAGVTRFVWSSLDGAATLTDGRIPVPHYDSKAAVEGYIGLRRAEEVMAKQYDGWYSTNVAVLVTAPYFENFQFRMAPKVGPLPDGREGVLFSIPLGAGKYPLIGLEDIAWFSAHMFGQWDRWAGRTLRIIGDSLTGESIAETFERVTGIPSAYQAVPLQAIRDMMPDVGHDLAAMLEFFQEFDLFERARDITVLRDIYPDLMSFESWLRKTGWTGGVSEVQKRPVRFSYQADS